MNIIVCVDDRNGMLFGGKRLSSDIKLCERVLAITKDGNLLMNEYSYKLFEYFYFDNIRVDNTFLNKAKSGDFCFVENDDFSDYIGDIEKIIVYRWNRSYPSDVKLNFLLFDDKKLLSTADFSGNSHERITEEVYG